MALDYSTNYTIPYPDSADKVNESYLRMEELVTKIDDVLFNANLPILGDTTSWVSSAMIDSSVALAGSPTTTTQSDADDSTKIATTEFVNNVAADIVLGIVAPGTITNTMLAGGITDAKIDAAAAIAYSKLNLATSIVNADVSASAAIAYSKLNLATSVVNADISASAGIVDTKLATISTASKVSNSATTAASANTASAIVARDASGDFTAGTVTVTNVTAAGYLSTTAPVIKTADFTVAATENWLISNKSSSCTVTLPTVASFTGREITIKNLAAFTVVSASSNVKPIGTNTAGTAILPATAGTWCTLVSDGTNWIVMQSGPGLFS